MSLDEPGSRFAAPLGRDFKNVRIAWSPRLADAVFEKSVIEVFEQRRNAFESLGCVVEEAEPDLRGADAIFRTFRAFAFYAGHRATLAQHRDQIKDTVVEEIERGAQLTPADLARAEFEWAQLLQRVGEFMGRYEFFVLPTTQVAPFDVNLPFPPEIEGAAMKSYIDWMRSCYYITVTALPAISVPAGFCVTALPIGLQIVGRRHADWSVLQLAHAYEEIGVQNFVAPDFAHFQSPAAIGPRV
jgi:amidase